MTKTQQLRKKVQDEIDAAEVRGDFPVWEAKIREHELLAVVDKLERGPGSHVFVEWLYARAGL